MQDIDIISKALENQNFREVVFTGDHTQVVVMSLNVGEDIGLETHHKNDQILMIVSGTGEIQIGEDTKEAGENELAVVPAGTPHNVTNRGETKLKLITIYGPPDHAPGTVHTTKTDARKDEGPPEQ